MNKIHETVILGNNVKLGSGNVILPYTIIDGPIEIGNDNVIGPHCVIGCSPTDTKNTVSNFDNSIVKIGNNNIIREFCVIEQPCYEEQTVIEDNVFLMQGVHISHDICIKSDSVITNNSVIAGIVKILDGANIAMGCTINQYTTIGQYSIIATGSACMKNVKPFSKYIPGKPIGVNIYAVNKFGFSEFIDEITNYVIDGIPVKSQILKEITNEFDFWVNKYNRKTYN